MLTEKRTDQDLSYVTLPGEGMPIGTICRSKEGAPARYIGHGNCLWVGAMSGSDLFVSQARPATGGEARRTLPTLEVAQEAAQRDATAGYYGPVPE
jgi:hypothetical protein